MQTKSDRLLPVYIRTEVDHHPARCAAWDVLHGVRLNSHLYFGHAREDRDLRTKERSVRLRVRRWSAQKKKTTYRTLTVTVGVQQKEALWVDVTQSRAVCL